ncbi:F0F1 ATP synthase subunit delta [Spongiactinospora sp. TRM90649]|uniref:F0F1 ATP synthase subunit delta n=1 Tax=Spongiactinospora sp. TRM90649 TaxID=3031114 RepID=UPI0023F6E2FF|nr:F0F1 ATP synthase subunit delta [Spongiactinospora sp. TRM90649]MDF5752548.1 F0F1 ATP synthase subunit delta [Spongiactinospora sp. TRM90649]
MMGQSRASLASVEERFNAVAAGADLTRLADDLFAVAGLFDREHGLRRALSDPSRPAEQKAQTARVLLEGKVGEAALETIVAAVSGRWTRAGDIADALERVAVTAAAASAESAGQIDDVEDELFRFGRIVEGDTDLRRFLSDAATSAERKEEFLDSLLGGKVTPVTSLLVKRVVAHSRGRSLEKGLVEYGNLVAAQRERLVAVVRSAVALTDGQKQRLAALLRTSYGRDVRLNVEVDPRVVGGFSVRVGDELIDTTIAARIEEVRRRLAG